MDVKAYVAGPFFNDEQVERVNEVIKTIRHLGVKVFSPKDDNLFKPGGDVKECLRENTIGILNSDVVVAITDGKDVGTMWECGYAFAKGIPVIYVWLGFESGMKFNVMLAASAAATATSLDQLEIHLAYWLETGEFLKANLDGVVYE